MIKDYYEVLEIPKSAKKEEICESFRKLSLKWHPDRNSKNRKVSYTKFSEICEAFEILSDMKKKSIFDKKGISLLKNGYYIDNEFIGGYEYKGNCEEIFEKFFGTNNFYSALIEFENEYGNFLNEKNEFKREKPKDIKIEIDITTLDLYFGKTILCTYEKKIINSDGFSLSKKKIKKKIKIPKGYNLNNFIYKQEGNETPGFTNSDLIINLKEKQIKNFQRKNLDLFFLYKISLLNSLLAKPFKIKSIDGRDILVSVNEIINPKSVIKIEGEGMVTEGGDTIGDLYVRFDIRFPKFLSLENKEVIKRILK